MWKYFVLSLAFLAKAAASPSDEIEGLLAFVGGLEGASFVRNGEAYPPAAAVAHLRLKWTKQKADITTAEDFIRLCGAQSSMSGQPYLIRFGGGREEPCARVLSRQLAIIRKSPAGRSDSTQGAPGASKGDSAGSKP